MDGKDSYIAKSAGWLKAQKASLEVCLADVKKLNKDDELKVVVSGMEELVKNFGEQIERNAVANSLIKD